MKLFRRRTSDEKQRARSPSPRSPRSLAQPGGRGRQSVDFVKRRVKLSLALLDRPLMPDTEFIIDARYRQLKVIGSGSYGIVVSAQDSKTGDKVAIKQIFNAFSSARMARHVLREVRLLRTLDHKHVISLLDVDVPMHYKSWQQVYLVMPLLKCDLTAAMRNGWVGEEKVQKKIAYQLLKAIAYLHSRGIMHRDIKARNVLVDEKLDVQVCDLGQARFYSGANGKAEICGEIDEPELTGGISTRVESAPEVVLGGEYNGMVDIWAAGCVIGQMVMGGQEGLFDRVGRGGHLQEIVDLVGWPSEETLGKLPDFGRWYMKRVTKGKGRGKGRLGDVLQGRGGGVVERMLRFDPRERCSAEEALKMEWFDEVREGGECSGEADVLKDTEPGSGVGVRRLKEMVWQEVADMHPEAREWSIR